MMIPFFLLIGLGSALAWALQPRDTLGEDLSEIEARLRAKGLSVSRVPLAFREYPRPAPPPPILTPKTLLPEETRLVMLLILWSRDRQFPRGAKRFMTKGLAIEAMKIATRLGLPVTARAIATDSPIPLSENLRGASIANLIANFERRACLP